MGALRSSGRRSWWVLSVAVVVLGLVVGFGVAPAGAVIGATTEQVSVSSTGTEADRGSYAPSISADGRFVAFASESSNLVDADTNGLSDAFVHDRTTLETRRGSVSATGVQGQGESGEPSISADGRFVAFTSSASNLVPGDTNRGWEVFVYDWATQETRRVSVSSTGAQGHRNSNQPSISADGRFVAFGSTSRNLVEADTNDHRDVFVYDMTTQETERVSVSSTGTQANDHVHQPSISANGRFVAFYSRASNLVRGDTNGVWDVFVHDRATHRTRRVSVGSTGTQANGLSGGPSVSADGRFVAFWSSASNLVRGDTNDTVDVFVYGPLYGY